MEILKKGVFDFVCSLFLSNYAPFCSEISFHRRFIILDVVVLVKLSFPLKFIILNQSLTI